MGKRCIHILIDTSSTHNFLDTSVAAETGILTQSIQPLRVAVVGGNTMWSSKKCMGLRWASHGTCFETDVYLLPLAGFDMVLGMQWLRTLEVIQLDCANLSMVFNWRGHRITLNALPSGRGKIIPEVKMMKLLHDTPNAICMQIILVADSRTPVAKVETVGQQPQIITWLLDEFEALFATPHGLPLSRGSHDHRIILKEGTDPIRMRPYRYPAFQKDVIEGMIKEMLDQGIIQHSSSLFASPVGLVKKKDGSWRMCVDYRALNKVTVRNSFPIPLIEDLLDELVHARVFSKLNLRDGYHHIRMQPQDVHKTAFQTHGGHYKYLVMPFGLTNAPSTFQSIMNSLFTGLLRKYVLVFFDDILIYSPDLLSHISHLHTVFSILQKNQLLLKNPNVTSWRTGWST